MRRKKSRQQHRGVISERLRSNWQAIGLYTVTGVIMIGAVAFAWQAAGENVGPDGCPVTGTPQQHIAVLHDGTTRLKPFAVQTVALQAVHIQEALPAESRLSLFVLTHPEHGMIAHQFTRCKPKAAAEAHWLYESEAVLEKQNEKFDSAYQAAVHRVLGQESGEESHIMAAIFAVSAHKITHLVLVSDMLENSPACSMLRRNFTCYDNSLYVAGITQRLKGVKILIIQLRTRRFAEHQKLARAFWDKLFQKAGAEVGWVDLPDALS